MKGRTKGWLIVFLAGLSVRLPLLFNLAPHPDSLLRGDSSTYLQPAKNLAGHGVFSASLVPPLKPDAERTPGYPAFLAAHFLASKSLLPPSATQVLLDAGTGALVALAASSLSAHPAAWMAGLLYALDPIAAAHSPLILSEALFNFLLTLAVLLLLRAGPEPAGALLAALSGLCLGAATWVRPISVYLWLPWTLALAAAWTGPFKRRVLPFAAAALLLPGLWCARNWAIWGSFSYNPVRATDAMVWEAAAVQASVDKSTMNESRRKLMEEFQRRHPGRIDDPIEEARLVKEAARRIVAAHPAEAMRLYPVSALKMMLGPGLDLVAEVLWPGALLPSNEMSPVYKMAGGGTFFLLKQRPILWAVWAWINLLLALDYGLAALGAWALWRARKRFAAAACLVPVAFLMLISSGGWAYYRHRVPLLPLLAVLAAGAFDLIFARHGQKNGA